MLHRIGMLGLMAVSDGVVLRYECMLNEIIVNIETVIDLNHEYRLLRFYFEKRKNRERKLYIHFKCNQDSQRYIQGFCQCRESTKRRIQKPSLNATDIFDFFGFIHKCMGK